MHFTQEIIILWISVILAGRSTVIISDIFSDYITNKEYPVNPYYLNILELQIMFCRTVFVLLIYAYDNLLKYIILYITTINL